MWNPNLKNNLSKWEKRMLIENFHTMLRGHPCLCGTSRYLMVSINDATQRTKSHDVKLFVLTLVDGKLDFFNLETNDKMPELLAHERQTLDALLGSLMVMVEVDEHLGGLTWLAFARHRPKAFFVLRCTAESSQVYDLQENLTGSLWDGFDRFSDNFIESISTYSVIF